MILHAIVTTTQQNSFPHICVKPFDPSQKNCGDMAAMASLERLHSHKIAGESMPYRQKWCFGILWVLTVLTVLTCVPVLDRFLPFGVLEL